MINEHLAAESLAMVRNQKMSKERIGRGLLTLVLAALVSACATNTPKGPNDPWEKQNRKFYNFNDSLDRKFFTPVAKGYVAITPKPVRASVTNVFENVGYLNVIANDLLQGKLTNFAADSGRFIVNSSIGLGGIFDPATSLGLPAHDEDFGQTLGKWGAGEGRYLVLPLMGPNSFRDLPDIATSMALNPLTYISAVVTVPLGVLNLINMRANLLEATNIRDQAALDPYTFVREAYRQMREFKIYDGNPPSESIDDYLDEDDGDVAAAQPAVVQPQAAKPAAGAEAADPSVLKVY